MFNTRLGRDLKTEGVFREGNYKDKYDGKYVCFQRPRFLLEKTHRILLSPIFSVYFVLSQKQFLFVYT